MSAVNDTLADAEREFVQVMGELETVLAGLTPVQRVFGLCAFALVLLWFMMRPSKEEDKDRSVVAQFSMAMFLVVLFGAGIGVIFVPFAMGVDWLT